MKDTKQPVEESEMMRQARNTPAPFTSSESKKDEIMKWNGYYIRYSQDAYAELIKLGYKAHSIDTKRYSFMELCNDKIYGKDWAEDIDTNKPFYLINGEFTAMKEEEVKDGNTKHHGNSNTTNAYHTSSINTKERETISITSEDDGVVYEFEKEERYKVFEFLQTSFNSINILGAYEVGGIWHSCVFDKRGIMISPKNGLYMTPIKKPWYENPDNFPAMCVLDSYNGGNGLYIFGSYYEGFFTDSDGEQHDFYLYRLSTKEEISRLYYKGKEDDTKRSN